MICFGFVYSVLRIWEIGIFFVAEYVLKVAFNWISSGQNLIKKNNLYKVVTEIYLLFFLFIWDLKMSPTIGDFLTQHFSLVCVL